MRRGLMKTTSHFLPKLSEGSQTNGLEFEQSGCDNTKLRASYRQAQCPQEANNPPTDGDRCAVHRLSRRDTPLIHNYFFLARADARYWPQWAFACARLLFCGPREITARMVPTRSPALHRRRWSR